VTDKKIQRRVIVYSGPMCPFCARAKRLLDERSVAFEEVDVTVDLEQRDAMIEATGRRTIPQILIDGKAIGGFTELAELDRNGELAALLGPEREPGA
jgi:glutaredoxin 3